MKNLTTLLITIGFFINASAQYCGNNANAPFGNPSGPGQCAPSGTLAQPGLTPYDSIPPLVNGTTSTTVIQFQNFDTLTFGNQVLTVQSLKFDSIGNLPNGLCWATNVATNFFNNSQSGCIKLNGTICAQPGQYRLKIILTVDIGGGGIDGAGIPYYLRVKNAADADTPIDTTGQTVNTNIFIPYGAAAVCSDANAIIGIENSFTSLSISPNPFTGKATVSFFSNQNRKFTERITNLLGSEVYKKEIEAQQGENKTVIDRGNLAAGVYFYSLSDGKTMITKRIVVD